MPEDKAPEEQIETPSDEAAAFASETDDDEGLQGLEQPGEKAAEDKIPDEPPVRDKLEEAGEAGEEAGEEDEEDEEDDEDVIRGKEILAEQEQEDVEKKAADEAAKTQRPETGTYSPFTEKHDAESIEFMKSVIPPGLFPDTLTLKDGTELDFAAIYESEPEIPVMIVTLANNLIRQMIANKYLVTSQDIAEIRDSIDNRFFERTLTNKQDGVSNAKDIFHSPGFKKWLPDQTKEIQALLRSGDPYDHIRLYKRFINSSGLKEAKSKVKNLDEKRRASKEKFDSIHKTTIKSKAKAGGSALSPREQELEGFNARDDDDDFFSR